MRAPTRLRPVSRAATVVERHVRTGFEIGELRGDERPHVGRHFVFVGQRHVQRGGVRVLDHQLAEVVQPLAEEHGDDVRLDDRRIVGPAQHLDRVGRERAAEVRGVAARHHELGELDDHRDAPRRARRRIGQRLQVQRAQQVAVDQLQRRAGLARQRQRRGLLAERRLEPVGPVVGAARRPHAAAAVVAQHDVVGREHDLLEEGRHGQQLAVRGDDVEDVAVEEELGRRPGAEQIPHLGGPAGQLLAHWLSRARVSVVSGGGSVSRSSIAP